MLNFRKKILDSFNYSKSRYNEKFYSYHWKYQNNKKNKLYSVENLINFRNNNLSYGLDDQFYTEEQTKIFFSDLIKEYGKDFIYEMLENENIGKVKDVYQLEDKYYSANELFHIWHLARIKNKLKLSSKNIICEIGPGYGSFISKFLKFSDSKAILIDLPESNFLSSYFLNYIFPNKKFFLSSDIKNKITRENILENDIIIICPWDELPDIKIDFFINSRSMMEMKKETINYYFDFIHKNIANDGFFLCINRYYKDTVGYPIELHNYPFDSKWKVLISESAWKQPHIHFLFLQRSEKNPEILSELKEIKKILKEQIKNDSRFIRRILPNQVYKIYKHIKYFFLNK